MPPGRLRPARPGRADAAVDQREVQVIDVATHAPSPFARSLLFGYVAQFVYEGDSPIAERRAAALSLDQGLLAELLGRAELRELLDPEVLAEVEAELQRLTPERRARGAEGVADLLRLLGPLTTDEVQARSAEGVDASEALARARPPGRRRSGSPGSTRWAAIEDVGRLRDGLGVAVPPGTPDAFTDPVDDPLADLVSRYARTHGPFTTDQVAARLGLGAAVVRHTLQRLAAQGRVLDGEFRPSGSGLGVVRRRGAAVAAAPVAGPAAQGGRAGPARRARPVPARLAARGSTSSAKGLRGVDGVLSVDRPARRCAGPRRPPSSRWCCPPGSATTSRPTSTSSPPPARCSGPATRRCPAPTAGSRCTSPTRRR